MRDDLQAREPIEQAGEDHARHRRAGLVRPPEGPPDLVLRTVLASRSRTTRRRDTGAARSADRAGPSRRTAAGTPARSIGLPRDVRENLDAARAEIGDGAIDLLQRRVGIVQRQRRDEAGKAIRIARRRAPPCRRWRGARGRRRRPGWRRPRSAAWQSTGSAGSPRTRPSRGIARRDRRASARRACACRCP